MLLKEHLLPLMFPNSYLKSLLRMRLPLCERGWKDGITLKVQQCCSIA